MNQLESYISGYFGISNDSLSQVASMFEEESLSKGDYYVKAGRYCHKLSFLKSGYLRIFRQKEEKEITQWISGPDYFVTDLSTLIFQQTARWDIQALTDCQLYTLSNEAYKEMNRVVPDWPKLEKLFIAKCFLTLEDRVFSFLSMTAEERYNVLFEMNSDIFNQVPLLYLASMLGMTPETLSRIRKKALG